MPWCLHYHQQVNLIMEQERVNTYLSNQPASACATALLLLLRVAAGFMPAMGGQMIFDLAPS